MIKNIILLTKISVRNFFSDMNIFNKESKKINKKSIYFWLILVIIVTISYVSNTILNSLQDIGKIDIFLNIFFAVIFVLMFFQTILISTNMLYFSKDMENLLIFPVKPIELLMSKFNTILSILYGTEIIFMFIPMILYAVSVNSGMNFYIQVLVVMFILPIFPLTLIGILNLLLINLTKIIKNRNIFQLLVTIISIVLIVIVEYIFMKNVIIDGKEMSEFLIGLNDIINTINRSILIIQPIINFLNNKDILLNLIKIVLLTIVPFFIFVFIGNKCYIKQILNITFYERNKQNKIINIGEYTNISNINIAYIKNEFRLIFRNMSFFIQYIFPRCMFLIVIIFIVIYYKINLIDKNLEILELLNGLTLDIEGYCWILGICQVLFSLTNMSLTAISRQGKNAVFMKYIPINLHMQFLLKSIPQNIIDIISSIILIGVVKYIIPTIPNIYLITALIDAILLSIINSCLMLIVDLKRPILNWKSELEVVKQNGNKLFQYVLTIAIILLLMYFINILKEFKLSLSILIITCILGIIILVINRYVKIKIKNGKLFNNIN